ncbi:MAG: DUF4430 domain-containing protein [Ruminococcaceae bacterium]|nr:DUF4430 domain-containing protein [Oscillospiraceae bacterium]
MKTKNSSKKLLVTLSIVLIAVMALLIAGCTNNKKNDETSTTESTPVSTTEQASVIYKGEGEKAFVFIVTDSEGKDTHFMIKTDKETVGEALMELNLISGEEGQYGLYVKTVNGITLDYDKDGKYWAFYEENAYANQGVDQTEITEGGVYTFKAE